MVSLRKYSCLLKLIRTTFWTNGFKDYKKDMIRLKLKYKIVLFILLFVITAPIHEGIHVLIATHIYHGNNISVSYPFFGLNPEYPVQKYLAITSYQCTMLEKDMDNLIEEFIAYSIQLFIVFIMYKDLK